ncbi:MAG: response regulator [Desulfobacteraceae bacterium]|nr:response regulator [Desulfobacteraceae bacterium]
MHQTQAKVLVVDDSAESLQMLTSVLETENHMVLQATNGEMALRIASYAQPDLILMDVRMPGMSGYDTCRHLKEDESLKNIPVIFLSGLTEQSEKVKAFQAGGVDYVEKPARGEEVIARVRTHLELYRMRSNLESLVHERTWKLEKANEALRFEILHRRQAETMLCGSETRYRHLYHNTPVMMHSIDNAGSIIVVNDYWLKTLGYRREEVIRKKSTDFLADQSKNYFNTKVLPELFEKEKIENIEFQMNRKNGDVIDVLLSAVLEHDDQGNAFYLAFIVDITQRKRTEARLRLDEERLEAMLRLNEMNGLAESQIVEAVLEDAVKLTGSEFGFFYHLMQDFISLQTFTWSKGVLTKCTADKKQKFNVSKASIWADCIRTGKSAVHNDFSHLSAKKGYPEGHVSIQRYMCVPIHDGNTIIGVISVGNKPQDYDSTDVRQLSLFSHGMWRLIQRIRSEDERKKLETQLRQAQKMEAIGTLAGGIAHDFNNILSPIMGYAEIELLSVDKQASVYLSLKEILNAGKRAKNLISQIVTFSRQVEEDVRPMRLQPVIKEVLKLIKSSLPSTIRVNQRIQESCGPVMADPTQIHQIIMNLCTNAFHAMKEEGGVLEIHLQETELSLPEPSNFADLQTGAYVKLMVTDTGTGMDKKEIERIFDPYFTTKKPGEGTGLGLAVVHGIVNSLGGSINVYSQPGEGAAFQIYLPLIKCDVKAKSAPSSSPIPAGREHILVVDDEETIAMMIKKMLISLGYDPIAMTSSERAYKAVEKDPNRFDLVITDLTMPCMTGIKLTQKLLTLKNDLPIIMCTGFNGRINEEKAKAIGVKSVIMKPVALKELAETIRKVLDKYR